MDELQKAFELHRRGDLEGAEARYRRVLSGEPDHRVALRLLGALLLSRDDTRGGLAVLRRGVQRHPDDYSLKDKLVGGLERAPTIRLGDGWDDTLIGLLEDIAVDPRRIRPHVLRAARRLDDDAPVVRALLSHVPITDARLEGRVTALRRRMSEVPTALDPGLSAAVALQVTHCEYAHWVEPDELDRIDALVADRARRSIAELTSIAAYRRLADLPDADELAAAVRVGDGDPRHLVIDVSLHEPRLERVLAAQFEPFGSIDRGVSRKVRGQYEEHPYPRWQRLGVLRRAPLAVALTHFVPMWSPPAGWPDRPAVLVAGCGTGSHPLRLAMQHPETDVLGVDLSLASLGHAARKAVELGIANVEWRHGDLLDLPQLGETFDYVECSGVLHHLEEPLEGWRALCEVLRPGGLMRISLYSERARRLVVAARECIAERGYRSDADGVRRFRRDLFEDPTLIALTGLLKWSDFYSLSECRDLLFHVQEHRFTPLTLAEAMDELDLEFLGFDFAPSPPRSLIEWDDYERRNPDTFRGMYEFFCRRKGD